MNTGGSGAAADIGFGVSGEAFTSSLTAAQATSQSIVSAGATSVSALSFTPMPYGSDPQTITVSASDVTGTFHTTSITLRNDDQGREGSSIDESIAAINAQLQQSASPVQLIVAIKQNVGGEERIGFLSKLRSFQVSVGSSANADGLNGGATVTESSSSIGSPLNVTVDTADAALLALSAVTSAVSALGAVQAIVGKAENQFSYAIDLSTSQVTNFSTAESRIRDTDVAAEAANLTKAQIMEQSSIATMTQANSAAQAVLALLRG